MLDPYHSPPFFTILNRRSLIFCTMILPATACLFGLQLESCLKIYATYDISFGVLRSIIAIAGLSHICYSPSVGIYKFTWILNSINSGFVSVVSGWLAVLGIQGKSLRSLTSFSILKSFQVILALVIAILIFANLEEVSSEMMDEYIRESTDEADHAGITPPEIDRHAVLPFVEKALYIYSLMTVATSLLVDLYGVYLSWSIVSWYKLGIIPSETFARISLVPILTEATNRELQYVSPQLQGQQPLIPVAFGQ